RFFFSSRRRHTRCLSDWSSDVCSSDLSFNDRHETDVRDFGGFNAFQSAVNHAVDATTTIFKHNYFTGPWVNEANLTYEHFKQEQIGRASCRERAEITVSSCALRE